MQSTNPLASTLHEWMGIFRRIMMGNFFVYARNNGLTLAQFGTMLHIFHKGACGVSDIGSELGVTNSAASQMLERLVQLKLINRTEDPADRRVKQIVLTEKGQQLVQESGQVVHAWMETLAGSLAVEEQELVKRALTILIEKANQLDMTPVEKPCE